MKFTTKDGRVLDGALIRQYRAFEGDERYIIEALGVQYRCVKDENGELVELVL